MVAAKQWLVAVLRAEGGSLPELEVETSLLLPASDYEGVTALVGRRLATGPAIDAHIREVFAGRARTLAAAFLFREAEYRRVFATFERAGISPLLLKGSALGYWLYPMPYLRETADFDLLFESPEQAQQAADLLRGLGYTGGVYFGEEAHEATVRRRVASGGTLDIDLHWGLFNHPAFGRVLPTKQLFLEAVPVASFHARARGLSPAHATVHACLHRAMNLHMGMGDRLKWLYDLYLLADQLTAMDWDGVLGVCREQGVSSVCLDAFRATAEAFGTRLPDPVLAEMGRLAQGEGIDPRQLGNWWYMQLLGLRSIPTVAGRVRWLYRKLFPSLDYLRSFYGHDLTWSQLLVERVRRFASRFQ